MKEKAHSETKFQNEAHKVSKARIASYGRSLTWNLPVAMVEALKW